LIVVFAERVVLVSGIARCPCELLPNHFNYFRILRGWGCDLIPCAKAAEDQNCKDDGRNDGPGKLQVVVVGIEFGFATFSMLVVENKKAHDHTNDSEGYNRHSHCDPEDCISPRAVLGRNGQIVIVEVDYGIPEEANEADNGENQEQSGVGGI